MAEVDSSFFGSTTKLDKNFYQIVDLFGREYGWTIDTTENLNCFANTTFNIHY